MVWIVGLLLVVVELAVAREFVVVVVPRARIDVARVPLDIHRQLRTSTACAIIAITSKPKLYSRDGRREDTREEEEKQPARGRGD